MVNIYLNGKKKDIEEGMNISDLLFVNRIRPEVVVVEVNEKIIERNKYKDTILIADDKVEFVYYMGGGERKLGRVKHVLEFIDNTPLIKLNKVVEPKTAAILAKAEFIL